MRRVVIIFPMEIRRITNEDADLLQEVRLRSLATDPSAFGSTYEREVAFGPERWESWSAEGAAGGDSSTLVAIEDDAAVGIVVGVRREQEPETFDVFAMWVAPEARGRGVARDLLAALEAWMAAAGGREARLSVTTEAAAARRLYERVGYEPLGWTQESRHTPGLLEVGMSKRLAESEA